MVFKFAVFFSIAFDAYFVSLFYSALSAMQYNVERCQSEAEAECDQFLFDQNQSYTDRI